VARSLPGHALAAPAGFYHPFSAYPITGTWQDHLTSGSLGGIDYGMSVGTRLPAAGGGVVINIPYSGTGGHTVTIQHDTATAPSTRTCRSSCRPTAGGTELVARLRPVPEPGRVRLKAPAR
jgi:hypothetical protein